MTPAPSSDPFDPWGLAPGGPAPDSDVGPGRCDADCPTCHPAAPPGRLATLRAFLGVQRQAARGAVLGLRRGFWGLVLAVGAALAGLGLRRLAALSRHQKE